MGSGAGGGDGISPGGDDGNGDSSTKLLRRRNNALVQDKSGEEGLNDSTAAPAAADATTRSQDGDNAGNEVSKDNAPFWTWLYFLGFLCAMGLTVALFSGLNSSDNTGPLAMPSEVREHFARGRLIKVEIGTQRRSVKVFVRSEGPQEGEVVLLLHGMGSSSFLYRKVMPLLAAAGLRGVAVDLPGSGLSEKFTLEEWKREIGGVERLVAKIRQVFHEVMEKGPFWRMEQLFETGALPESELPDEKVEIVEWPVGADPEELGEALAQVLDSLGSHQVHLVVHDTGSEAGRALALRQPSRVRSITIIDSAPGNPSLPLFLLGSPGIGSFILGSRLLYSFLLKSCCLRVPSSEIAEAHAFLLRSGSGRAALLEMARMANSSTQLGFWYELREVPIQVLWSNGCSKEWKEAGKQVSVLLPDASLVFHGGSKWPQEDAPQEIAEAIQKLVLSLAPSERPSTEEPEHIQKLLDSIAQGHHDHHHHHHDDHGHGHEDHHHSHGYGAWGL